MTNNAIIYDACVAAGLYTEDELQQMLSEGHLPPLHTFAEWKKRGMIVRKGEHACLSCYIWIPKSGSRRGSDEPIPVDADGEDQESFGFYKKKAFFFQAEQCEPLTDSRPSYQADDAGQLCIC